VSVLRPFAFAAICNALRQEISLSHIRELVKNCLGSESRPAEAASEGVLAQLPLAVLLTLLQEIIALEKDLVEQDTIGQSSSPPPLIPSLSTSHMLCNES
jgi:hypothetical protein